MPATSRCVDTGHVGLLQQDLRVRNLILPLEFQQLAEIAEVETIEFHCMSLVDSPGLACIEKGREDNSSVDNETSSLSMPLRKTLVHQQRLPL